MANLAPEHEQFMLNTRPQVVGWILHYTGLSPSELTHPVAAPFLDSYLGYLRLNLVLRPTGYGPVLR